MTTVITKNHQPGAEMGVQYKWRMRPLCPACRWINGEPPELERLRGRPVLVLFWSLSNRAALPQISRLEKWIRRHRLPIEVVSVHTPLSIADMDERRVISAIQGSEIRHPVALDGDDGALADVYDVRDLPAYFLFDAQLVLRDRRQGTGAVAAMERLLAKSPFSRREAAVASDGE